MQRSKEIMSMDLYGKLVREFAEMGGGALLLTPIVGEFFLDPHWLTRIAVAREYEQIGMISVTSNGICLDRLRDEELTAFLRGTNFLQISVGDTSREEYKRMFGVDRYDRVKQNIVRLATLRNDVMPEYPLRLGFRVGSAATVTSSEDYALFRQLGYEIAVETNFGNWGGTIRRSDLPANVTLRTAPNLEEKKNPCFVFYMGLFIAASGKATSCGCMDAEVVAQVGDCREQSLHDIWHGRRYAEIRDSFGTERMPNICKECSFYSDGVAFAASSELANYEVGQYPFGAKSRHVMFERPDVHRDGRGG